MSIDTGDCTRRGPDTKTVRHLNSVEPTANCGLRRSRNVTGGLARIVTGVGDIHHCGDPSVRSDLTGVVNVRAGLRARN